MVNILKGSKIATTENGKIWEKIKEKLQIHYYHEIDFCTKIENEPKSFNNNCTMIAGRFKFKKYSKINICPTV